MIHVEQVEGAVSKEVKNYVFGKHKISKGYGS